MQIVSEQAKSDLREIWEYLAERNPDAARRVIIEITDKFDLLEHNPLMGRVRHDLIVNLRAFPVKKYMILYTPLENGVEIFRVIHGARDLHTIFDDMIEHIN
jgi:toxin ParE1/3/4